MLRDAEEGLFLNNEADGGGFQRDWLYMDGHSLCLRGSLATRLMWEAERSGWAVMKWSQQWQRAAEHVLLVAAANSAALSCCVLLWP